ncbi:hypothetical protein BA011_37180 (plasmid) [Rhizobium leguminosarum]|uniref:Uncharacterized protein n=1 Tax=Rhizobium leguminosarum TaxID=384 RepID=A0A1B1CPK0_RHILE|nr:hypothetical protein BA011_37180 [Rhizobium leguminosarum]
MKSFATEPRDVAAFSVAANFAAMFASTRAVLGRHAACGDFIHGGDTGTTNSFPMTTDRQTKSFA